MRPTKRKNRANSGGPDQPTAKFKAQPAAQPAADILETLGVAAFARMNGVSPDCVLAVIATVLPAVAGPVAWTSGRLGPNRLGDLNLLVPADNPLMMRLVDRLTAHAAMLNQRLATKMTLYSATAIECVIRGAFGSGQAAKLAPTDSRDRTLADHQQALRPKESRILLHEDLKFDPVVPRAEAISHPEFLLEHVRDRELVASTEACHYRTALLINPQLGLERGGSEPRQAVKSLASLLAGTINPVRTAGASRPAGHPKARLILTVSGDDLKFLHSYGRELHHQLVWVPGPPAPAEEERAGDAAPALAFVTSYQNMIEHLLSLRREGRQPMMWFNAESSVVLLDSRVREFVRGIDGLPHDPGSGARALPGVLAWSLGFLCQMLPVTRQPSEEDLIRAAVAAADRLLEAHLRKMDELTIDKQVELGQLTAGLVMGDIVKESPVKLRVIARKFHLQRKENVEPILSAMLEAGVLVQDGTGAYRAGPIDLYDAEEVLSGIFRAAVVRCVPLDTLDGSSAEKPKKGQKSPEKCRKPAKPAADKPAKPAAGSKSRPRA